MGYLFQLRAGTGVVGLPFIGDIDGDSTPEVFVPQANKLHVYSFGNLIFLLDIWPTVNSMNLANENERVITKSYS